MNDLKKGDQIPVNIAGDVVAQATIERVDTAANTVTMVIPATRVVMGLRTEIDTSPQEPVSTEPSKQTIITGVDRVDSQGNVVPAPGENAPVAGNEGVAAGVEGASPVPVTGPAPVEVVQDNGETSTPEGTATQTELVEPTPPVETPSE